MFNDLQLIYEDVISLNLDFLKLNNLYDTTDIYFNINIKELKYECVYSEYTHNNYDELYLEAEQVKANGKKNIIGKMIDSIINFIKKVRVKILRLFGKNEKADRIESTMVVEVDTHDEEIKAVEKGNNIFTNLINKVINGTATKKDADDSEKEYKSILGVIGGIIGISTVSGAAVAHKKGWKISDLFKKRNNIRNKYEYESKKDEDMLNKAKESTNQQNMPEKTIDANKKIVDNYQKFVNDKNKVYTKVGQDINIAVSDNSFNNKTKEQQESSKSVDKESPEQIQPKNNNTAKEETKKYNGHAHDEIAPLQGEYKAKIYGNVHEISSPYIGNELTSEEKEIAKKLYDKSKNKTLTYGDVDQIEKLYKKYRDNTSSSFSCSERLSTLLTDSDFTQHLTHEEKIKLEEIDNRAKNKTTIQSDNTYVRNLFNTTYSKLSSDVKKQRREKNKSDKKNKSTKTSKNETDQSKDSQVESDESKTQDDTSNKKNKCADFKNQPSDVKSLVKDAHILMSTVKDFVKTYFKIRIKSGGYDFYLLDEKQGEEILRHVGLYEQGSFIGRLDAGNKKYEAAINDVINYSEYVLKFKDKYSSKEFYKAKGQESKYDDDDYESEDEDVEEVYEEIEEKLKKVKKQLPALKNVMFESSYDLINDILTIFENSFL